MRAIYAIIVWVIIVSLTVVFAVFIAPSKPATATVSLSYTPPPVTPCKVKVKVDAEGNLVVDLQTPLGTAPLPDFDMSEWRLSLDAYCASRK